jgi:hypothetical protein
LIKRRRRSEDPKTGECRIALVDAGISILAGRDREQYRLPTLGYEFDPLDRLNYVERGPKRFSRN